MKQLYLFSAESAADLEAVIGLQTRSILAVYTLERRTINPCRLFKLG
jgi:hypothetical protein